MSAPEQPGRPPLLLLSGERGVGKSTACQRLVELLDRRGWRLGGILTLTLDQERYVLDVATGARRLLAAEGVGLEGPRWGRFAFCQAAFDWSNRIVQEALSDPLDLLLLDELGPLELERQEGFWPAWQALLAAKRIGLVVVRPALLAAAQEMAGQRPLQVWTVTRENRDELPARIAAGL